MFCEQTHKILIFKQVNYITKGERSGDRPFGHEVNQCRLLYFLILNIGKPVSTEDLISYVWGSEKYIERQELYVYINRLRNNLEDDPKHPKRLLSLRGFGYRLFSG